MNAKEKPPVGMQPTSGDKKKNSLSNSIPHCVDKINRFEQFIDGHCHENEILRGQIDEYGDERLAKIVSEFSNRKVPAGRVNEFLKSVIDEIREYGVDSTVESLEKALKPSGKDVSDPWMGYVTLPTSSPSKIVKQVANNPNRVESPRRGQITTSKHYLSGDTVLIYKGNDSEFTLSVERTRDLFPRRIQNGARVYNFILQKLNEQHYEEKTYFMLQDLIDCGIYKTLDSAYRGLKGICKKMGSISIEGTVRSYASGKKKEVRNIGARLIAQHDISYQKCFVSLPSIIRDSTRYITILPRWGYSLGGENSFMLLDYIFYIARQNVTKIDERGYFTLSLDSIRMQLGLPGAKEVEKSHHRNYNQHIINPIEKAITDIEDSQEGTDIRITPCYDQDYKNIHEYLNGYLKIELSGQAFEYMKERSKALKTHKKARK